MFNVGKKEIDSKRLPESNHDNEAEPKSLEEALKIQYEGDGDGE